jgi:hypothetical protein
MMNGSGVEGLARGIIKETAWTKGGNGLPSIRIGDANETWSTRPSGRADDFPQVLKTYGLVDKFHCLVSLYTERDVTISTLSIGILRDCHYYLCRNTMTDYVCQIEPCACKTGWCPHYRRWLFGRAYEMSKLRNELGDRYRARYLVGFEERPIEPVARKPCNCGGGHRNTGRIRQAATLPEVRSPPVEQHPQGI